MPRPYLRRVLISGVVLILQYARLKRLARNKHSSLKRTLANYGCKKFHNIGPRVEILTILLRTSYKLPINLLLTYKHFTKIFKHFMIILQTFFKHFSNILQTFFKHFTNILQTLYKHFTNTLQTLYKHLTNILQTFYKHFTNIYKHLKNFYDIQFPKFNQHFTNF